MWTDLFLDAATNLKEIEIFLIEPVSSLLKLVCNVKYLSYNYFHNIVKSDFTFSRNYAIFISLLKHSVVVQIANILPIFHVSSFYNKLLLVDAFFAQTQTSFGTGQIV